MFFHASDPKRWVKKSLHSSSSNSGSRKHSYFKLSWSEGREKKKKSLPIKCKHAGFFCPPTSRTAKVHEYLISEMIIDIARRGEDSWRGETRSKTSSASIFNLSMWVQREPKLKWTWQSCHGLGMDRGSGRAGQYLQNHWCRKLFSAFTQNWNNWRFCPGDDIFCKILLENRLLRRGLKFRPFFLEDHQAFLPSGWTWNVQVEVFVYVHKVWSSSHHESW